MLAVNINRFIYLCFITHVLIANCEEEIKQLPHCKDTDEEKVAVIVSTLDGRITSLNNDGVKIWHIDTGPGPLLISNIHKLELTNNGQWIRIIPSLTGSLYKFDGINIDAIPINAYSLLKSSFLYSDDLVIAGGREVRTYGVAFNSGKLIYECSLNGCQNKTDNESNLEDILVIERSTLTVRAHEPRSGIERWNFSVGLHNIKLPQLSCVDPKLFVNYDLTAVVPKGILIASLNENVLWQHQFDSPIVNVWKWDGEKMAPVSLFTPKSQSIIVDDAVMYLGMHNKQLYIHESEKMLSGLQINYADKSNAKIPWKPISATDVAVIPPEDDRTTALSVLYSSEYVNDNGFYLYVGNKNEWACDNLTASFDESVHLDTLHYLVHWFIWLQCVIVLAVTIVVWNRKKVHIQPRQIICFSNPPIQPIISAENIPQEPIQEKPVAAEKTFNSRFTTDFETVRCLGKGGYGIVFEVRQKIDECSYAIKRTPLPNDKHQKDKVMREVRILAKLDHPNIVRYYNSWVESPPSGWSIEHDEKYLNDTTYMEGTTTSITTTTSRRPTHKRTGSTVIDIDKNSNTDVLKLIDSESVIIGNSDSESDGIYFERTSESENIQFENELGISSKSYIKKIPPERELPLFLYIQMQLCQKQSLKEWLFENNTRNYTKVLNIFSQILDAVEYIHSNGLIHRDLKPSNIFLSFEGNVKVGDFGLVTGMEEALEIDKQCLQSSVCQSHTKGVGTQLYMSPEQRDGKKYNYKIDIFSLGIIFFELLVPFSTEMGRIKTLTDLRTNIYPNSFVDKYDVELDLLRGMLCETAEKRPSTTNIKLSSIFYHNYNRQS